MNEIRQKQTEKKPQTNSGVNSQRQQQSHNSSGVYIPPLNQSTEKKKTNTPKLTKRIVTGAGILFAASVVAIAATVMTSTSSSVDTSIEAQEAVDTRTSTSLKIGTRISSEDDSYVGEDLTITHSSDKDEAKIYVWDYAAEDGDYVQILVDGVAICDPFMIVNKAVSFSVPTTGEISVIGTRDGGGGITYGVYYEVNQTTYFNGMDQGGSNIYTLIKE